MARWPSRSASGLARSIASQTSLAESQHCHFAFVAELFMCGPPVGGTFWFVLLAFVKQRSQRRDQSMRCCQLGRGAVPQPIGVQCLDDDVVVLAGELPPGFPVFGLRVGSILVALLGDPFHRGRAWTSFPLAGRRPSCAAWPHRVLLGASRSA